MRVNSQGRFVNVICGCGCITRLDVVEKIVEHVNECVDCELKRSSVVSKRRSKKRGVK